MSVEESTTENRHAIEEDTDLCDHDIAPEKREEMQRALAHILLWFKLDWKVMKAIMLTTGAVISGSAALAVLQGGEFIPQDLDIYVTSKNMAAVLVFLQEQNYAVVIPVPGAKKNVYPKSSVTLTLRNDIREKIDLVATTEQHVIHAVTQFHSTCVMNYIVYYGIVCLYPEWTMRKTAFVKAELMDEAVIHKYQGRRFAMMKVSSEMPEYEPMHKCGTHQCCPKTRQELHDHTTLCIPLDNEELTIRTEEDRVGWILDKDHICSV